MNHAAFSVRKYYALGAALLLLVLFRVHTHYWRPEVLDLVQQVNAPFSIAAAETSFLYLCIHGFMLLPIFALSFDKRVCYYQSWKYLLPAILIVGLLFIVWDFIYTAYGVWGFSHDYTLSYRIWLLPIEEWMFFFSAPFACMFIYACLRYYFPSDLFKSADQAITLGLAGILFIVGLLTWGKLYTSFTCLGTAILLVAHYWAIPNTYRTFFYKSQLLSFIPFTLINGVLTGSITATPVVQYNPLEMLDIRFITIPVEDFVYCFMLLLSVVTVFEYFREKGNPD